MTTLPPRITDADVEALPIDAALEHLLAGLLDTPEGRALVTQPVQPGSPASDGSPRSARWIALVAAAAAVALVVTVPSVLLHRHDRAAPVRPPLAATSSAGPTPTTAPTTVSTHNGWVGPTTYAVLDVPDWRIDPESVITTASRGLSLSWSPRFGSPGHLDLEWLVTPLFDRYLRLRTAAHPDTRAVEVVGRAGTLFSGGDQTQIYVPIDARFGLRISAVGSAQTRVRSFLAHLSATDAAGFAAALPTEVVGPAEAAAFEKHLLVGSQQPEGFDADTLIGYVDRRQAHGIVAGDLGCAWALDFVAARQDGRMPAALEALSALRHARTWPLTSTGLRHVYDPLVAAMAANAADPRVLAAAYCPSAALPPVPGVAPTGH